MNEAPFDVDDIDKYIFDSQNPKQCKSYNLLLNIAKKNNLVYVSDDFVTLAYEKEIVNDNFTDELWDTPENYNDRDIFEKVKIFKEILSEKDYQHYINSLKIDKNKFIFNRIFKNYFDIGDDYRLSDLVEEYNEEILKLKITYPKPKPKPNYGNTFRSTTYHGPKVVFTNSNIIFFNGIPGFFDRASVVVTSIENQSIYFNSDYPNNLKPLFLKNMKDIKLLLNILEHDLKRKNKSYAEKDNIYKINKIEIKNFFSIKNIKLENLKNKKEIYIVGENGDGKTLLLQALALGLKGVDEGDVFNLVKSQKDYALTIEDNNSNIYTSKDKTYKNFFAYGANRNNNCQMKEDETGYLSLYNPSLDLKNPIDWLKYLDHSEKSDKKNVISVENAKVLFQELLASDVQINIEPDKVTFSEKGSVVSFEQLSAGYQGVITIVADLLVRLSENQPYIEDIKEFKGVVVIDEVELHLHPKWKYSFVEKLRAIFKNIQFIMTTHSPTVLLGAAKDAVFYKIYKEEGEVKISNQIKNEGYTNNTLVSSPLFNLETVISRNYDTREKSLSNDDYIYEKIHKKISQKIQDESLIEEAKIANLIENEIDKL